MFIKKNLDKSRNDEIYKIKKKKKTSNMDF